MVLLALILLLGSVSAFSQVAAQSAGDSNPESQAQPSPDFVRELRSLNSGFPMQVPDNLDQWQSRREEIRRRILVSQGLWPMPPRTSANAVVQETVDCGEFKVYRVTLESYPGFYVTGNLYVPNHHTAPMPGVLYAHGHWTDARFMQTDEKTFERDLESGAEKFNPSGSFPLQAACVGLARIGCVAFFYDMIGHADSIQIPHLPGVRDWMNTEERWGLFSPQAELRLQNFMGLQTYNSLCVFDWFSSLPFIDSKRIGMTGASGGGTQTMILSAIDDRLAVSFPAVMVSTDMQGGCTCENAPYLRIDAGNIDFAATFAPKPLGMTAANDWTRNMENEGFPDLKHLYTMFGKPENVGLFAYTQFPHNYNQVAREAMYFWMNRHLNLGIEEPITEKPFEPLTKEQLTVWTAEHPKPANVGEDFERDLLAWMANTSDEQMRELIPTDKASLEKFWQVVGGAYEVIANRKNVLKQNEDEVMILPPMSPLSPSLSALSPKHSTSKCLLVVSEEGKSLLLDADGNLNPSFQGFFNRDFAVATVDLPGIGMTETDFYGAGNTVNPRYQYLYTFGYNDPLFVFRSKVIGKAIDELSEMFSEITVLGLGDAGKWVPLAVSQGQNHVTRVIIDTQGFRFAKNITSTQDPDFVPGATKYFDLPGMIALCAPREMFLFGETEIPEIVGAVYRASDAAESVVMVQGAKLTPDVAAALF